MARRINPIGYIASRAFHRPLLLEEGAALSIANYLENRMFGADALPPALVFEDDDYESQTKPAQKNYDNVGGVGVLKIIGSLVNRSGWMEAACGLCAYETLRRTLIQMAHDDTVKAILLDIDSGGGEVDGNFELARLIREINNDYKTVIAISNSSAYSGAYSLGCAAGEFYVTETGGVGSVGVIIQHCDYSKQNEMRGIKVTNIKIGDRKAWFDSNFVLSDEAKEFLEKEIQKTADMFINHVAIHRNLSEDVVRDTQAGLIFGEDAVKIGFVDGVISYYDLLQQMTETDFTDYQTKQGG